MLKKAVVDEQMRNTELNEKLRSKEQLIRRSNLEMEALNFRNSQLTVRITVLQEEVDSINNVGFIFTVKVFSRSCVSTADSISILSLTEKWQKKVETPSGYSKWHCEYYFSRRGNRKNYDGKCEINISGI